MKTTLKISLSKFVDFLTCDSSKTFYLNMILAFLNRLPFILSSFFTFIIIRSEIELMSLNSSRIMAFLDSIHFFQMSDFSKIGLFVLFFLHLLLVFFALLRLSKSALSAK